MRRVSIFDSPFFLGFEQFEHAINRAAKASGDGYPPYNIEQCGDDRLRITLAVAGFTMADLSVMVEDSQLVIRGKQAEPEGKVYLHRGIAARQFQRSFILAEGIEIVDATLDSGLLHIELKRPLAVPRLRTVRIRNAEGAEPQTVEVEAKQVR
ncbi:MAG: Hsp20 family protein [Alphaproteobacteria bacterium]